jgi:hypothetical protein
MMRGGFPDIQWTLEEVIAEGDKVAARFTMRGTHRGAFFGVINSPMCRRLHGRRGLKLLRHRPVGGAAGRRLHGRRGLKQSLPALSSGLIRRRLHGRRGLKLGVKRYGGGAWHIYLR